MSYVVVKDGKVEASYDFAMRGYNPCIRARLTAKLVGGEIWMLNDFVAVKLPT